MATLTVWKFKSTSGASAAEEKLVTLAREGLVKIHDAATVTWEEGKKKPKTRQLNSTVATGTLGGSFWGLLFGLLFFIPLLGAAVGAASGALAGALSDVGIDDEFIDRVRKEVTPGTSALFLMSSDAVMDRVKEAFSGDETPELLFTNLSHEQESAIREVFAE